MRAPIFITCRYCGVSVVRMPKWAGQRFAPVCDGEDCRRTLRAETGRRGGQAASAEVKSAARKAAWDRVKGVA